MDQDEIVAQLVALRGLVGVLLEYAWERQSSRLEELLAGMRRQVDDAEDPLKRRIWEIQADILATSIED